jgi:lysophospholipase L1-like esterase
MLDGNGVVLQDIFVDDNLHMNAKGYDIWTNVLKPILEQDYTD